MHDCVEYRRKRINKSTRFQTKSEYSEDFFIFRSKCYVNIFVIIGKIVDICANIKMQNAPFLSLSRMPYESTYDYFQRNSLHVLQPSFLSRLFDQKKIMQFIVEFIVTNVIVHIGLLYTLDYAVHCFHTVAEQSKYNRVW